jgi:hypothetical protein
MTTAARERIAAAEARWVARGCRPLTRREREREAAIEEQRRWAAWYSSILQAARPTRPPWTAERTAVWAASVRDYVRRHLDWPRSVRL